VINIRGRKKQNGRHISPALRVFCDFRPIDLIFQYENATSMLQSAQNAFFWYITLTSVINIRGRKKQNGRHVSPALRIFSDFQAFRLHFSI